ncbi:hypothetical protein J6590_048843 [Homalodisca vitripennis]|nr:hypothetical protein J6590_048843 [Homalodisca vitripennis]
MFINSNDKERQRDRQAGSAGGSPSTSESGLSQLGRHGTDAARKVVFLVNDQGINALSFFLEGLHTPGASNQLLRAGDPNNESVRRRARHAFWRCQDVARETLSYHNIRVPCPSTATDIGYSTVNKFVGKT